MRYSTDLFVEFPLTLDKYYQRNYEIRSTSRLKVEINKERQASPTEKAQNGPDQNQSVYEVENL